MDDKGEDINNLSREDLIRLVLKAEEQKTVVPQVVIEAQPQRLKIFTGLPPKTNQEASYYEWDRQAAQLLKDTSEKNPKARLLSSLRGLAYDQIDTTSNVSSIREQLKAIYGDSRTADDLYLAFAEMKPERKETMSDFFLRLWAKLLEINTVTNYESVDFNCKLFRTYAKGIESTFPLLALELRNTFGHPGTVSPAPADVLQCTRRLEPVQADKANKIVTAAMQRDEVQLANQGAAAPVQGARLCEEDRNLLLEVKQELANLRLNQSSSSRQQQPSSSRRRPIEEVQCFGCGLYGHYRNRCPERATGQPQSTLDPEAAPFNQRQAGNAAGLSLRGRGGSRGRGAAPHRSPRQSNTGDY